MREVIVLLAVAISHDALAEPVRMEELQQKVDLLKVRLRQQPSPGPRPVSPRPRPVARPAAEVALLGGTFGGHWRCKLPDGVNAPLDVSLGLGSAWLVISGTDERGPAREFRTFDAVARIWTRVVMSASGGYTIETSLGDDSGTWTWTGEAVRHREQHTDHRYTLAAQVRVGDDWRDAPGLTCSR